VVTAAALPVHDLPAVWRRSSARVTLVGIDCVLSRARGLVAWQRLRAISIPPSSA
jgi:hypothetical protein